MKKSPPIKRSILLLLVCLFLGYGLWPLGNPKYSITFNQQKIDFRKAFLDATQPYADSLIPPNVVLILADDLSVMDVSAYGGKNVKTQHIDQLATNGVRCTEGYISSPICAPSRAGLLTGRYQQRFGFEINIHERYPKNRLEYFVYANLLNTGNWKVAQHEEWAIPTFEDMHKQGLPPTEFLLSELLKSKGYATAAFGKWHLGYNPTALPTNRGFDYHYGFYEAFSLYAPVDKEDIINQKLDDFSDPHIWGKARTGNCAIRINDSIIEENEYLTHKIAQETNTWIQQHKDRPFFAYVPFSAPHTPFQVTRKYYDNYSHVKDPKKRIYYAMIHALDDAVGSILNNLKDLGLEENTLVIFLSDNGGATYTKAADNSPFKGGKMSNFEGGIRVPFIMQWKGVLPKEYVYSKPVSALDLLTTIAQMCQLKLPEDRTFDGVDLIPYWTDSSLTNKQPHEALFWRSESHKAVRKGPWKLIRDDHSDQTALYNLQKDISEKKNLATLFPDTVQSLLSDFDHWEQQLIPSNWPRVMDMEIKDGAAYYYFPL